VTGHEDPGWEPVFRAWVSGVLRSFTPMRSSQRTTDSGLTAIRLLFVALAATGPLYVVAFAFLAPWDAGDEGIGPLLVIGVGCLALVSDRWISRRRLDVSSPKELAHSYRRRMFLGIAVAEVPGLLAIVSSFIVSNSLWLMVVGATFSLGSLWMVAPSRRNLQVDQLRITERGSSLDIVVALDEHLAAPPGANGSR
jgi:F0F1-type ATP synthase membrane subunit c/vacuolar-type H+-ATPase subunit K